jgi:NADPH2:quinone reductase
MRAVLSREPGPPESLAVEEIAEPVAGPGEVVVDIAAVGLNFLDTLIIRDRYQFRPERPFSPGAEMAGTVAALGAGVTGLAVGDRVSGHLGWNCCREKVAISAERLARLPDAVPFEVAAGLTITYGTTILALEDRAAMQPGETLAVLGASGGVGQAAVEIGKLMGASVIACAGGPEKLAFARACGADEVVDYEREDLKERLKALTSGRGVDVIYDPVGGAYSEAALRAIAWLGRHLVIGFAAGEIPKIPLNLLLLKGCDIRGVFFGEAVKRDPAGHTRAMGRIHGWVADGSLRPHIDRVVGFDEVPAALAAIAAREVKGKVIVRP